MVMMMMEAWTFLLLQAVRWLFYCMIVKKFMGKVNWPSWDRADRDVWGDKTSTSIDILHIERTFFSRLVFV